MHTTNLRKVGGAIMLAVPPVLLSRMNLGTGTTVTITVGNGRLIIDPKARPRYSLDQLLAQCDENASLCEKGRVWLDAKPVGNELL